MRFVVNGNDKDSGQPLEIALDAPDVPSAAAMAERKGIRVSGVRPVGVAVAPPALPAYGPQVVAYAQPSAILSPVAPSARKTRLWFGLFLLASACLSPFFPSYTAAVGLSLAGLVVAYLVLAPMRRGLGAFLRVSPHKPARRVLKLTIFIVVAAALILFAAAGREAKRASAELAAKKAQDDDAHAQAEAAANRQVADLVEKAKVALTTGDIPKAEQSIDLALKIDAARNRALAYSLQSAIKNSNDPSWALSTLARMSAAEFEAFKGGGKPPLALDLGYPVLTSRAVNNAHTQINAALTKRAEIKKQEDDAAEEARRQAAAAVAAEKQKAIAEVAELKRIADAKAAAEAAERAKFEKGMGETIHIGYTSYCAWDAHYSDQLSTNQFLDKRPNAKWLFVRMTIRNDDKEARMVPPIKLIDEQGREYESSAAGTMIENSIGVLETLNPDVSKQGYVVFDVPENRTYKMKLSGGYWSTDIGYIRLTPKEK